ncbi:MAG TPA: hypothetical protein EYG95_01170 [Campylobacterales bacterium]|nr:hypothetical protein [Campylobacterales bacterium]
MSHIDTEATEEFLDTYEGEIIFVCDDLGDFVDAIDKKRIDRELLTEISEKAQEVSDVFLSSTYTQHVTPIFLELANFLRNFDVESYSPEHEGYVYLARIVEDIKMYIDEYFVKREFTDVYVFEDSLLNSIQFMERAFAGEVEEDLSEVEFF